MTKMTNMDFNNIIEKIKAWGSIFGIPIIVAVGYQFHLERVEVLNDQIELLNEKAEMIQEQSKITRYDNALNIINAQRDLHKKEQRQLIDESKHLQKKFSDISYKNKLLLEQTSELENTVLKTKEQNDTWKFLASRSIKTLKKWEENSKKWEENSKKWEESSKILEEIAGVNIEIIKIIYNEKAKEKGCWPLFTKSDYE